MKKSKKEVYDEAKRLSRKLRRRMTKAESIFWEMVRDRRFLGKKFTRQYPVLHEESGSWRFYIVDFYCHTDRLAVELDGTSHEGREAEDGVRSEIIEADGIYILRFRNEQVEENLTEVLVRLKRFLKTDSSPHPPSLQREGGESQGG